MNQLSAYCGKSTLSLTRSQSESMVVDMAMHQKFIVAAWRNGEPIIYGIGQSAWAATNMARMSHCPDDTELCTRTNDILCAWRGTSGRLVTIDHLLTIDD